MSGKQGKSQTKNAASPYSFGSGEHLLNQYESSFDALLNEGGPAPESAPTPKIRVMAQNELSLVVLGFVRSPLKRLDGCPRWHAEAPPAVLELFPEYAPGVNGMEAGQHISVLTWLHKASRNVLQIGDYDPGRGVFCSRSPERPNTIGLHDLTVSQVKYGNDCVRIYVTALEALDGTPILDIKTERAWFWGKNMQDSERAYAALTDMCARVVRSGLLAGHNGNASLHSGSYCFITESGVSKGSLQPVDFAVLDIPTGGLLSGTRASSESTMHLEIYRNQPNARCVLHCHPPNLLALSLKYPERSLRDCLSLPLTEAGPLLTQLAEAPAFASGSEDLARAVGKAAAQYKAVWMKGHGLAVWGTSTDEAAALSEELEHLASIALLAGV